MIETVSVFTEITQFGLMQSFLNHYVKSLKTGIEYEGLLIGQLFPIFPSQVLLSFQDRNELCKCTNFFFLDLLPAFNSMC